MAPAFRASGALRDPLNGEPCENEHDTKQARRSLQSVSFARLCEEVLSKVNTRQHRLAVARQAKAIVEFVAERRGIIPPDLILVPEGAEMWQWARKEAATLINQFCAYDLNASAGIFHLEPVGFVAMLSDLARRERVDKEYQEEMAALRNGVAALLNNECR